MKIKGIVDYLEIGKIYRYTSKQIICSSYISLYVLNLIRICDLTYRQETVSKIGYSVSLQYEKCYFSLIVVYCNVSTQKIAYENNLGQILF